MSTPRLLAALLFCFLPAASVAQNPPTPAGPATPAPGVRAGDDRPRRVLIRLAEAAEPEGRLRGPERAAQRARLKAARERMRRVVEEAGGEPGAPFETLPWVAASLGGRALEALAARADVAAVLEDPLASPALASSVPLVGAPAVWAGGFDGGGWTVAVLDTGVDRAHPFVAAAVAAEACFSTTSAVSRSLCAGGAASLTGVGAGTRCDAAIAGCDHGTHVAGIVAGRSESLRGVAPRASILAVQIFSRFDDPAYCGTAGPCVLSYTSDQVRALEHVYLAAGAANAARIAAVNLSLAGALMPGTCDITYAAVKDAVDALASIGIPTIVAAGNAGAAGQIAAPACVSTAVAIGASDRGDRLAAFSNRSPQIALLAPGEAIVSSSGGGYAPMSGTSMAAPHVAGAWALLKQARPAIGVPEAVAQLRSWATRITDAATGTEWPRLAVAPLAGAGAPPGPVVEPPVRIPAPTVEVRGRQVSVRWAPAPTPGATYTLQVGSTAGLADIAVLDMGEQTSVSGVLPPGTYYVRVATAPNAVSEDASFTVGAGAPAAPTAAVRGREVTLRWRAATGGPSGYVVAVGSRPGAADLAVADVGLVDAVVTVAPPGTYYVRILARTPDGLGPPSEELTVVVR